ncbi:MAG: hypothetical protein K8F62_14845 [Pseudorhodoplanes sp.]|nr:hypothetical protein [Pseudorhodoplanes sp.]
MSGIATGAKEPSKQEQLDAKKELQVMGEALKLLEKLAPESRRRVFSYLMSALGVVGAATTMAGPRGGGVGAPDRDRQLGNVTSNEKYSTFAELYDAARPSTGAQKALVGGYWFQICQGAADFVAADVNNELRNAVGPLSNVTVALGTLKAAKPSLVIQTAKSGKAQQARKTYKLTIAGIRAVEEMIAREG